MLIGRFYVKSYTPYSGPSVEILDALQKLAYIALLL